MAKLDVVLDRLGELEQEVQENREIVQDNRKLLKSEGREETKYK